MLAQFVMLFCIISIAPSLAQNSVRSNDEDAVREIVSKYVDARERIDPKAVEALFTSDADQLVSSGEWRRGREAVVKGSLASSQQAQGKRTVPLARGRWVRG